MRHAPACYCACAIAAAAMGREPLKLQPRLLLPLCCPTQPGRTSGKLAWRERHSDFTPMCASEPLSRECSLSFCASAVFVEVHRSVASFVRTTSNTTLNEDIVYSTIEQSSSQYSDLMRSTSLFPSFDYSQKEVFVRA